MELQRTKDLYLTLLDKLKSNTITKIEIADDKIRFELEIVKPHITYTEYVELPMAQWFLEQYGLR